MQATASEKADMAPPAPVKCMPTNGLHQSNPGVATLQSQLAQVTTQASTAPSQPVPDARLSSQSHPAAENGNQPAVPTASPAAPLSAADQANAAPKEGVSKGPEQPLQPALPVEAAIERVEGFMRRLAVEHDKEGFFQQKVSTELRGCEDYYERVKHPMWFARIGEKVR